MIRVNQKESDPIRDPFKFPFNGRPPKTAIKEGDFVGESFGAGEVLTLLNLDATNDGVIQEIFIAHNAPQDVHNGWLDVYYPDIELTAVTAETPETTTTIHLVAAPAGLASAGTVMVTLASGQVLRVTYTGKTGNDLTGCTKYPDTALAGGETVSTVSLSARFTDLVPLMGQDIWAGALSGVDWMPGATFDTEYFSIALNEISYAQG
jgi:hypothetical protein